MSGPRVVVTGAGSFIGRALCSRLERSGQRARAVTRETMRAAGGGATPDLAEFQAWDSLLADADAIVHLAARAHVLEERSPDPLGEFRRINVTGALRVAEAAVRCGVRRLVFVSSVGVHGTLSGQRIWRETDAPQPAEPYSQSKWEAELALRALADRTHLELVVVRPPLAYGPHVPGNMLRLMQLVARGWPLPFGAIDNRRSLVAVDNLAALLELCVSHPAAAGRTFLVADGEDVSTPQLLTALAQGLGRPIRLPRVPVAVLRALAAAAGKRREFDRLAGNLRVDATAARAILGWQPLVSFQEGIRQMTAWYQAGCPR
jgi:nucleoside-diphosphate-sugar epimerase